MNIQYSIRGLAASVRMRHQIAADLKNLGACLVPVSAEVTLEREDRSMPPVQVVVVMKNAGREIRAAARDHTWEAAWRKVVLRLREQIEVPNRAKVPAGDPESRPARSGTVARRTARPARMP
jgi:hypothetical protein